MCNTGKGRSAPHKKPIGAYSLSPGPFDGGGDRARRKRRGYCWLRLFSTCKIILLTLNLLQDTVTQFATSTNSDPLSNSNNNNNNFVSHNHQSAATGLGQRYSGHYSLAELCPRNRAIPAWKKIDGTVISLRGLHDTNCTFSLQTRLPNQYFIVRFEELQLSCSEKLKLFDADTNYGQPSIKDYSCRDNMANVLPLRSTGTFLTVSYSPGYQSKPSDGFRFVVTAVHAQECPLDATLCRNDFCISKSLFCDGINHCMDASDELSCQNAGNNNNGLLDPIGSSTSPTSWFGGSRNNFGLDPLGNANEANLSNALMLLVILVLIIFACVIIFISAIYCRRDRYPAGSSTAHQHHTSHYAQYQHQLAQARAGVLESMPLHQSSSVMFANPAAFSPLHQQHGQQAQLVHQPQYQTAYFQTNPGHMLATATLDRRLWPAQHQATPTRLVHYHPAAGAAVAPAQLISLGASNSATSNQLAAAYQNAASNQLAIRPQQMTVTANTNRAAGGPITTQHTLHSGSPSSQNNNNASATNNANQTNQQASF